MAAARVRESTLLYWLLYSNPHLRPSSNCQRLVGMSPWRAARLLYLLCCTDYRSLKRQPSLYELCKFTSVSGRG